MPDNSLGGALGQVPNSRCLPYPLSVRVHSGADLAGAERNNLER